MSTDLFQTLTLGLLVIIILALLVAVSMLGKVRALIERRPAEGAAEPTPDSVEALGAAGVEDAGPVTTGDGTWAGGGTDTERVAASTEAEDEEVATGEGDAGASDEDSERPFERGGRWYFRRAGELLVYEEGTGEWVPAGAEDQSAVPGHVTVQRNVEAVAASSEPSVADDAAETPVAQAAEPSTSFAGQPLASAEEDVANVPADAAEGTAEGAVATSFEEPGGGTVDLEEAASVEEPVPASDSFWKCDSCGAINGSTATSCRMCFTPRP